MPVGEPPSPVSPQTAVRGPEESHPLQQFDDAQTASSDEQPLPRSNTQVSHLSARSPPPTSSTVNAASLGPSISSPRNRRRSSGRPRTFFQRLHSAFSPSTHDLKEYHVDPPDTSRPYLHKQQRFRLQLKSWTEWLITLILCLGYFLVLYCYQKDAAIDKKHRRIFNSLVTGVVLLLGVNLNNSLRSYAKMLRWRFLASGYRDMKSFDLIMGCDSIMNVFSLLRHGRHKEKTFPFNSKVQFFALLWLLVQLGIVVCIGIIGLTYNLDISNTLVNLQTGNTSSINLTSVSTGRYLFDLAAVHDWGVRGYALPAAYDPTFDRGSAIDGSYEVNELGSSRRWFVDYNPDSQAVVSGISTRYIDSNVVCKQYRVTDGAFGNLTYITYDDGGRGVNETLLDEPLPSGLYVSADMNATCGEGGRCQQVILFQAQTLPQDEFTSDIYVDQALRFQCNNTVSNVQELYGTVDPIYEIPPFISRMLGGMLAWSAAAPSGTTEFQLYQQASEFTWFSTPDETTMADYVSRWTIGGVAAMDAGDGTTTESGLARMYVDNGNQPIQAQVLDVKWWAAATILGAIPFVHFWTLIIVIFFANKVIIKDDNPIAVAKVYHTLLNKVGDHHGCMLTGDQLIETLEDEHGVGTIIYGTNTADSGIKHVDIFEIGSGVKPERVFPEGEYDGVGNESVRRRAKRTFNAHEYF